MYSISNLKDTFLGKATQVTVLLIQIQSLQNKFRLFI